MINRKSRVKKKEENNGAGGFLSILELRGVMMHTWAVEM